KGMSVAAEATQGMTVKGMSTTVQATAAMKVSGATTDVEARAKLGLSGGAMTEVKGGIIKLNYEHQEQPQHANGSSGGHGRQSNGTVHAHRAGAGTARPAGA